MPMMQWNKVCHANSTTLTSQASSVIVIKINNEHGMN
jgi:hypothetical protein